MDAAIAQLPTATGRQVGLSRSQWRLFIPDGYTHQSDGNVDLLVHFHGDSQTVWNNAAYADLNAVIVTVNYNGLSSAYSGPFGQTTLFQTLLDDAAATLSRQNGFSSSLSWDHLGVSSFSAGYGAVRAILGVPAYRDAIDSLLAADSLYATTASDGTPLDSQMAGYKAYASLAATGEKRFIFTHSQVPTFTYESTAETGDELLEHLDLRATGVRRGGLGGMRFYRYAEQGGFTLWGANGSNGDSHLSHLRYMGQWLGELGIGLASTPGDFNADGLVNAADYTLWRDGLGSEYTTADYEQWVEHFGQGVPQGAAPSTAVPEPAAAGVVVAAVAAAVARRLVSNRR